LKHDPLPALPIVACPRCLSACRIGSVYFSDNAGQCHRCQVVMTEAAVARTERRARYSVIELEAYGGARRA